MKRFLVLLVVLAGGLAWAAFSVPSNAATVNGSAISQQDLNSDVSAIAGSVRMATTQGKMIVLAADDGDFRLAQIDFDDAQPSEHQGRQRYAERPVL